MYSIVDVTRDNVAKNKNVGMFIAVAPGGLCSQHLAKVGSKERTNDGAEAPAAVNVFFQRRALLVAAGSGAGICLGFIQQEMERNMSQNGYCVEDVTLSLNFDVWLPIHI